MTDKPSQSTTLPPSPKAYIWLGLGALLWLFSVGGRWDLPLAAWLFSIFLLRFTRISRPLPGILLIWAVSIGAALFWVWSLAIPMPLTTVIGCFAYGTIFMLPYLLDRLIGPRLGTYGRLLLFPAAMAAAEFIMGVFSPLGTAYGLLAVTQASNLPLLQVTALTGPYGIGFLIGALATVANFVWQGPVVWTRIGKVVGTYAAVIVVVLVGGGIQLAFLPTAPGAVKMAGITPSMQVLDQANGMIGFPLLGASSPIRKADFDAIEAARLRPAFALVQDQLFADTRRAARAGAKVVVWSENAAVLRSEDEAALIARAQAVAREEQIYLSIAVNAPFAFDRTHLIGPTGAVLWSYDKAHPIPGLETYAPGGKRPPVVATPFGRLSNVICYDADFPALMHVDADVMLVPGGDWPEIGRVHTLRMASLRAIENGYSLFRVDYNGLSAAFDRQGRVIGTKDTTTRADPVMIVDVPTDGARTFYGRIGDVFAWLCVAGVALGMGAGLLRRRT